jgi:hypothetical protein
MTSLAGLFIYISHGKLPFPPLLWIFPHTTTFTSFPTLGSGQVLPLLPSSASLFIYNSMRDCPPLLVGAQGTQPSLLRDFFVVIAYYSVFFSFFPWVAVSLSHGL